MATSASPRLKVLRSNGEFMRRKIADQARHCQAPAGWHLLAEK
jgi:hypothetical protein